MRHRANPKFWRLHENLPADIKRLASDNFKLLKQDPSHPSLHFKKVGKFWSVRIGIHYRAIALQEDPDIVWFWIGRHDEYEQIAGGRRRSRPRQRP